MPTTVNMPQLGESIHEGTIERWLKQPGDDVREFDPLLEVMTDKVSVEVPAPISGKLVQLLAQEGETVQSGNPIAVVEEAGAAAAPEAPSAGGETQPQPAAAEANGAARAQPATDEHEAGEPHRYSPAVRAIAAEHNIDLDRVTGTGLGGRVTKKDVENFRASGVAGAARPASDRVPTPASAAAASAMPQAPAQPDTASPTARVEPPPRGTAESQRSAGAAQAAASTAPPAPSPPTPPTYAPVPSPAQPAAAAVLHKPPIPSLEGDERVPMSTLRRMIAEHVSYAKQQVPHAWQAAEVDMSRVVAFRSAHRDDFRKREGIALSYLPFVIKATTICLRENPYINVSFDGDAIVRHKKINIGVAVGLEDGLVVPVLKDADGLSLAGIARGVAQLADKARTRKLKPDDMEGATFTVNNPGTFGSTLSYSIINAPQAGILTMEAVVDRVVALDGMIAIRPIMFLCFSFDHRAFDGLQAARFLQGVRKKLEELDEATELY